MKNRIDDFIETLTDVEVSQLMYRISMRVLIPQYYTKEDIKNMFEEYPDSEFLKRMSRELKINSLIDSSDNDYTNSIFTNLIEHFREGHQVLDETLHNIIYDYVYKENNKTQSI